METADSEYVVVAEPNAPASVFAGAFKSDGLGLLDAYVDQVGWDARVPITPNGQDPFDHLTDDQLLNCSPAVIAAFVMAQANQMVILDSAIVPDSSLVEPTASVSPRFNEFPVYTPTEPAEKYAAVLDNGVREQVDPSTPFYPGLAERSPSGGSPLRFGLADSVADPRLMAMAHGCALLQIGIEAGHDVSEVAGILSKAWGTPELFSAATVAGVEGAHDYPELFSLDRGTDARRQASWQECSAIRSGQLTMSRTDWGANVHCDFRRIRVAAECLFSASVDVESAARNTRVTGRIVYCVPPIAMLSADPQYLFPRFAQAELFPLQKQPEAAEALLASAKSMGLLRTLWPTSDPAITAVWIATLKQQQGLISAPVVFAAPSQAGAALVARNTGTLMRAPKISAGAVGRTVMTGISSKINAMCDSSRDMATVGWLARLAAVVEVMALQTTAAKRTAMIIEVAGALQGPAARALEQTLTAAECENLHKSLPITLRAASKPRSSTTVITALLHELGNPATPASHTVLRGLRRALSRAAGLARAATVSSKMYNAASGDTAWLAARLQVLREFWAQQYSALSATKPMWPYLRNDMRWWVDLCTVVNTFRASVIRSFSVASDTRDRAGSKTVAGIQVYMSPYHAASYLRKELSASFATEIIEFGKGVTITQWLSAVLTHIGPLVEDRMAGIPHTTRVKADSTSHYTRAAALLSDDDDTNLAAWVERTFCDVCDDLASLVEDAAKARAAAHASSGDAVPIDVVESVTRAMATMAEDMAALAQQRNTGEFYEVFMDTVDPDAWEDMCMVIASATSPLHDVAVRLKARGQAAASAVEARAAAEEVNRIFLIEEDPTTATVV